MAKKTSPPDGPAQHSHPDDGRQGRLITRRDLAGWVDGPPREDAGQWRGQRLGLPQQGPTSIPGLGRRILALLIDWGIAMVISNVWFDNASWATLAIFAAMQILLLGTLGTTLGKRIVGIQVVRLGGAWAGPVRALVRTVLLCLVVPPLMVDADGRGAHERVAGTVQIRM